MQQQPEPSSAYALVWSDWEWSLSSPTCQAPSTQTHTDTQTHIHTHTHAHAYTHTHTHTYRHTRTHRHSYRHMHPVLVDLPTKSNTKVSGDTCVRPKHVLTSQHASYSVYGPVAALADMQKAPGPCCTTFMHLQQSCTPCKEGEARIGVSVRQVQQGSARQDTLAQHRCMHLGCRPCVSSINQSINELF